MIWWYLSTNCAVLWMPMSAASSGSALEGLARPDGIHRFSSSSSSPFLHRRHHQPFAAAPVAAVDLHPPASLGPRPSSSSPPPPPPPPLLTPVPLIQSARARGGFVRVCVYYIPENSTPLYYYHCTSRLIKLTHTPAVIGTDREN